MNKKIFFVMPLVLVSLVVGVLSGLFRMGWTIPMGQVAGAHGALMTGSFLGSLICLERIVALKKKWLYSIPLISALSIVLFALNHHQAAFVLLTIGSLGLIYIYTDLIGRFKEYYFYIMMLGAIAWAVGNILMVFRAFYPQAAPWWIAFILLTVYGERLELSKFLPQTRRKKNTMYMAIFVFMSGLLLPYHGVGKIISGIGLLLIAIWLLHYDIARKSVKSHGMHRFTGGLLLAGYFWLIACAYMMLLDTGSIYQYDAMLHTFFLGFTFSMIFAHAPIIFPGVAGINVRPFHPTLFIWAILFQLSLIIRVAGDMAENITMRKAGGVCNALVILFFFVNLAIVIVRQNKK